MSKINLLPWRDERRREAQRNFVMLMVLAGIVAAGAVFGVQRFYQGQIAHQNERNAYLQSEITKLDNQIKEIDKVEEARERLLQRKRVIEDLQGNRSLMVRLFDQLARTVPSGMRLINARQVGDEITITGTTQSETVVSTYLRNLEASSVLHDPRLRIIEIEAAETDAQMPYGFSIVAKVGTRPETQDIDTGESA
ncbi:MAG: PilN domain-containing protein [Wenzhouxiangellaceae bacterium]|nr:PilN domain-containing protein [Wenzhouxiangellaceae bacterium]